MKKPLRLVFVLLLATAFRLVALAAARDPAREAAVEDQLRRLDPTLVPAFHQATVALDAQNYPEAKRLLAPICSRLPDWDVGLRRFGSVQIMLGQRSKGLTLLEHTIDLNRSYDNVFTLATFLALAPGATAPDEDSALELLAECEHLPQSDPAEIAATRQQIQFQRQNRATAGTSFDRLSQKFQARLPGDAARRNLVTNDEDWQRESDSIQVGQQLAQLRLNRPVAPEPDESDDSLPPGFWSFVHTTTWVVGAWVVGLLALCGLGYALSKITLRQIGRADVNLSVTPGEHRLRKIYRSVLNIAGLYYYVSLPIVVVLVIAVAGGIVAAFLFAGWLPIKLILILIVGAIATIWSVGRSLFVRVKSVDPGRPVTRGEAEGLWQLAEQVARAVDTRPVDEIRLTVGTDLCVYERGTWREKLQNRAKRVLVIGAAVLDGFQQEDFRCVLAHEYGHFTNRDTAGGDIAMRVRHDMLKFYYAMAQAGQASWLNIAFHFLRAYNFIFRRISHGATRLQEVLADRVAAQLYGRHAFESGLRHVIRQSIEFQARANVEIQQAIKARRPLQNLYDTTLPVGSPSAVEDEFNKAMSKTTGEDDTHPAPLDRFRLIARIPTPSRPPSPGMVWDLFKDRAALVAEMLATVEKNIAAHRR